MFVRWKLAKYQQQPRWNKTSQVNSYHSAVLVESYRKNGNPRQRFVTHIVNIKDASLKEDSPDAIAERLNFWWRVDLFLEAAKGTDWNISAERVVKTISAKVSRPSETLLAEQLAYKIKHNATTSELYALQNVIELQESTLVPLFEALRDDDPFVRFKIARVIVVIGRKRGFDIDAALAVIIGMLNVEDFVLSAHAAAIVRAHPRCLADPNVIHKIVQNLDHANPYTRYNSLRILGDIRDTKHVPIIKALLKHDDKWTRYEAKRTLKRINGSESMPPMPIDPYENTLASYRH